MKSKLLHIYLNKIFFLIMLINLINSSLSQSNTLKELEESGKSRENLGDLLNYLYVLKNIFKAFHEECYKDITKSFDSLSLIDDLDYPYIMDYIGKTLNDIGDEVECNYSLNNTNFTIIKLNTTVFIYEEDKELFKYLDIKTFTTGVCIMNSCLEPFKFYYNKTVLLLTYLMNNTDTEHEDDIVKFIEYEPNNSHNTILYIHIFFLIYVIIKVVVGIIRLIYIPKGYEKHVMGLLYEQQLENADLEEKKEFFPKNNNELLLKDEIDYNSYSDFESHFSIKLKIFQFFDFFNDFNLLTTKKNRYFDDTGLETITLMRAIVILFMIFFGTFNTMISLPSQDINNKAFFGSLSIFFLKVSSYSLTAWIALEGAYTTYKLMCFIKTQILESYINTNKKQKIEIKLLIIYGKFILYFIPKTFLFFLIYYLYYYNVEDFNFISNSKKTFTYIMKNIFKNNITCNLKPQSLFNFNIFEHNYNNDYSKCYEFTYIYFYIFLSTLVFMIIIYFSFIIRKKSFEIIILLLNIILFFISVFLISDNQVKTICEKKQEKDANYKCDENDETKMFYKFYHFLGQNYSTRILFSLIGFYHIGYVIGFLIFHFEDNKYEFKYKLNKKTEPIDSNENLFSNKDNDINNLNNNLENEKLNEDNNINNAHINKNNNENNKGSFINYYPLSFLNSFLFWMLKKSSSIKLLIIFICLIFIFANPFFFQLHLSNVSTNFDYNLNYYFAKAYFLYEKHIFMIFFFIINAILITYPKTGYYKSIINSKLIIAISRTGFTITCLYFIFSYLFFSCFIIKVKFHISTLIFLSLGNFLIIFFVCFIINLIFDLPLRIIIKKSLRSKSKRK